MPEKVNLQNLKRACQQMTQLIDEMNSGAEYAKLMVFASIADEIRFELDGSDSCIPAVRKRAQAAT